MAGALSFGQKFSRIVMIAVVMAAASLGSAGVANAQQPGGCLDGIERLMREYQARYNAIANTNPDLDKNVVDWPPCCPTEKAPAFPPDGYYDSSLRGNPNFGVELVKALKNALCEANANLLGGSSPMPIASWFNKPNLISGEAGETPGYVVTTGGDPDPEKERWTTATLFDSVCGTPVTESNYCEVFAGLQANLKKLKTVRLPEDRVRKNSSCLTRAKGQCGVHGELDCTPPTTIPSGSPYECFYETRAPISNCIGGTTVPDAVSLCNPACVRADALSLTRQALECIWSHQPPCIPTVSGGCPNTRYYERCEAFDGTSTVGCAGPYWATSEREQCVGDYSLAWGDIDGGRNGFFRISVNGIVDSPYREGDVLGLPIGHCRVGAAGLPDYYAYPNSYLTQGRYATSGVSFGTNHVPPTPAGPSLWVGERDFAGDGCTSASHVNDLPDGVRGWDLGEVAGLLHPDFNTNSERDRDCGSECSSCGPAAGPRAVLGSVDFSWSLGRTLNNRSAGYVLLRAKAIPDRVDLASGGVFYPQNVISANRMIRNTQDSALVRNSVQRDDGFNFAGGGHGTLASYTIKAGDSSDADAEMLVETLSDTIPPYQTQVTTRSRMPDGSGGFVLRDTGVTTISQSYELLSGNQKRHHIQISFAPTSYGTGQARKWDYVLVGDVWTMREGTDSNYANPSRSQEETVTLNTAGTLRTTTRIIRDASNAVLSQEVTEEQLLENGWSLVTHQNGTDPQELRSYYGTGESGPLGYLKRVVTPTGFWTDCLYEDSGHPTQVTRTVSQWKDNTPPSTIGGNASLNVVHEASNVVQDFDSDGVDDQLAVQTTWVLGVAVEQSAQLVCRPVADSGSPPAVSTTHSGRMSRYDFRFASPALAGGSYATTGAAAAQRVSTLLGGSAGAETWRTASDQTTWTSQDLWPRATDTESPRNKWRTHAETTQSSTGDASFAILAGGSPITAHPQDRSEFELRWSGRYDSSNSTGHYVHPITHTQTIRRTDLGITVRSDTWDEWTSGSSVHISGSLVEELDEHGRATRTTTWSGGADPGSDARITTRSYGCCGVDQETSAEGVTTKYTYDEFKRVKTVARQIGSGSTDYLKTESVYDALGRVIEEWRYPTGSSPTAQPVRTNHYDANGRMDWTQDGVGSTHRTTYSTTFLTTSGAPAGVLTRTTLPAPTSTQAAPYTDQIVYPDGQLKSVGGTGAAAKCYDYGVSSGTPAQRYVKEYQGDVTSSGCTQWTLSWSDPLGRSTSTVIPLTSTTSIAASTTLYAAYGDATAQIDADGVRTLSFSGQGWADAQARLTPVSNGSLPSLSSEFVGQWSLSVQDLGQNNLIDWTTDRIALTRSYLFQVPSSTEWRRRSETLVWKTGDGTSTGNLIVTTTTDATLDGTQSWTTSFGWTSYSETKIERNTSTGLPTGTVTTTTVDPTGAVTESVQIFGRQISTIRRHPPVSPSTTGDFAGKTYQEYDALGRLSKSHFLRTESASLNSSNDDVTDYVYDSVTDQVLTMTGPSPTASGTGRHTTGYVYDNLGRTVSVLYPDSKQTDSTFNGRGQTLTVSGFGVNPVEYGYDALGRMVTLKTYQNFAGNAGAATTTWNFDPYSGRLLNKKYQGTGSSAADLAYTYKDSGRLLTRTTRRGIVTTYAYNNLGEPISTTYSDTTPSVLITARDRLGRVTEMADTAGRRTTSYLDDGRVLSEAIESDTSITGAPHTNLLVGISTTNSYTLVGGVPDRNPRIATEVGNGSSVYNHVDFTYDSENRLSTLTKSGGRVVYSYDPITGQLVNNINKTINSTTGLYVNRFQGTRFYDRLGRQSIALWESTPTGAYDIATLLYRSYATDIHGRRTAMNSGIVEDAEDWAYGYDDKNQLTSAQASFSFSSPVEKIPGLQFGYTYDDIGNRTQTAQGDALTGTNAFSATYTPNLLNQYTSRTVPGKIEVAGHSPASAVTVNSQTAYRYMDDDGFFHSRVGADNSAGPLRPTISILESTNYGNSGSYDVYVPGTPEAFIYDADGNLAEDGIWTYTWDGENRLVYMVMKPDIIGVLVGQSQTWMALSFAYDGMGRRIVKKLENSSDYTNHVRKGDYSEVTFTPAYLKKYVYDIGSWNLSTILRCNTSTGSIIGPDQTFAWGPDLSGTENGAGGIGGLAIYVDDYNDGGVGTTIGAMFPIYDGNGNVIRLFDGVINSSGIPTNRMADYRYGPFGEQRGQTGSQATRFPFRWSTKFTDNETGLVYYGYRYYSASMGRWLSNDPIAERGGLNLTAFIRNAVGNTVDAVGLKDIALEFEAFINGNERGKWLPEPGLALPLSRPGTRGQYAYEFSSDWRGFGQSNHNLASPNARVMSRAIVDSTKIGSGASLKASGSNTGVSHRRYRRVNLPGDQDGPLLPDELSDADTLQAPISEGSTAFEKAPEFLHDVDAVRVPRKCGVDIKFYASAAYPFIGPAPSIDYEVTFHLRVFHAGYVTVGISGLHDGFPDYEAYVADTFAWSWRSPGKGPGVNLVSFPMPLHSIAHGKSVEWLMSIEAETPCGCP